MSLKALLNTSVSDAQISLEGMLRDHPARAARTAIDLLEVLQVLRKREGASARRKMAATILRKAAKALEVEA